VKKGVVALLVILALIIIVSPGILGRLAEKSVDENLSWAAAESGDLVISSDSFDRGWFSSEGQHRVEIKEGNLQAMLQELGPPGDELPVLIINTHLDHGLIPVSSMSRENGSLAPGLGSAVSTLSVEFSDGKSIEVPGKIYSNVALNGELESSYELEAGSHDDGHTKAAWGTSIIEVTTNPSSGDVQFSGNLRSLSFADKSESLEVNGLTFSGSQAPTTFGFATGDVKMELDGVSVSTNGIQAGGVKRMSVDGYTRLDNGRVNGRTTLDVELSALPQFGDVSVAGDISVEGADAEALGTLIKKLEALGPAPDEAQAFSALEGDLKRLLSSGLELRFDQLDVTLPMGTVTTAMKFKVLEKDASTFDWTSLLLATEASANVSVPEALVDMAMQMNPQAGAMVGMGFLQKNGDVYEISAEYKKALLTINGQPMPIPLGTF
jgi:uncharacterized protein YdgA (DUF945 family)